MAKNKARFYIERLTAKGWTGEQIRKFCNLTEPRFKRLSMIRAFPKTLEVQRLRSMMRKTLPGEVGAVRSVWRDRYGEPPTVSPPDVPVEELTDKQREVIGLLLKSHERGHPECLLGRVEASVASRMQKRGLVRVEEVNASGGTVKRYGLSDKGLVVGRHLAAVLAGDAGQTWPGETLPALVAAPVVGPEPQALSSGDRAGYEGSSGRAKAEPSG